MKKPKNVLEVDLPPIRVLRHCLNYKQQPGELNTLPSMTVPDMAMSVPEIMLRFVSGRPLPQSSNLHYTGDDYLPDVRTLDLVQVHDLQEATRERVKSLQQEVERKRSLRSAAVKQKQDKLAKLLADDSQRDKDANNSDNSKPAKTT